MHSHKCIQSSKRIKNMVEKEIRLISETPLFVFGDILGCEENRRFPVSFRTDIYSDLKFAFIVLARLIVVTKKWSDTVDYLRREHFWRSVNRSSMTTYRFGMFRSYRLHCK